MTNARPRLVMISRACALAAAAGAAVLGTWWLWRPSQVVVELTRYAFVWAGPPLWALGIVGAVVARRDPGRITAVTLVAGAVLGLLLWAGPGSVTALSEVVVDNGSGRALTDAQVTVGERTWRHARLEPGQSWEFLLEPDLRGSVRLTAVDERGQLVSSRTTLVPDQPDRIRFQVDADGQVAVKTRPLWTRLSPLREVW